jgi:protocatechuate 3,4-dioxygenase beta subunit
MKLCCAPFFLALLAHLVLAQVPSGKPVACTLRGEVRQAPGDKLIRKIKVELTSSALDLARDSGQDEEITYVATTDAEGKFTFSDIKPGPYRLYAEHTGFFLVDEKNRSIRSQRLTLQSGEAKDLVLRMQPAGVITGKVLDRDGDPMPAVTVTATRYPAGSDPGNPRGFGSTNDQGEYRMASLRPGRYLISALSSRDDSDETVEPDPKENPKKNRRPERSYTTYYPGTSDKNQAAPVEIRPGDEIPININMVFGPTFRVRGSVANLKDVIGDDSDILLVAKGFGGWAESYSAPEIKRDGSFEIRAVPPGRYYLAMKSSAENVPQTTFVGTVEVSDSDLEILRIAPVPVSSVRGRVRLEGTEKNEWPGFAVALASDETDSDLWRHFGGGASSFDASVNRDGSFEIRNVPAGSYRVSAWAAANFARDSFVQSVHLGGADVTNSTFNVSGGNYSLEIVMNAQAAAIQGAVMDAKDQPVAGATVIAVPDAARRGRSDTYGSDRADQQGRFSLHGLAPGEYEVIAVEYLEDDYRDPELLKKYLGSGLAVRLEKGDHKAISLKVASVTGD